MKNKKLITYFNFSVLAFFLLLITALGGYVQDIRHENNELMRDNYELREDLLRVNLENENLRESIEKLEDDNIRGELIEWK